MGDGWTLSILAIQGTLPIAPMDSRDVRAALAKMWTPEQYVTIEEAPDSADRGGRKLDALVCGMWSSRGYELDGVEIKISMSDWQRELKDAAKADWWFQHVHRFWVAVPAPLAVKVIPDLPPAWGLLACSETGCKVAVKATKHEAVPLPWSCVLGLLRASSGCGANALLRARREGTEEGERRAREKLDRLTGDPQIREDRDRLAEKIAAFERESGISLRDSWNIQETAKAAALVKQVISGNYDVKRVEEASQQLQHAAKNARELAEAVRALTDSVTP